MNRYEESKIPELDDRIEHLEKKVKDLKAAEDEEIKEVFFQEILFDKKLYKDGESKVNLLLKMSNVHIFKKFQTESGLVLMLGKWGPKQH